MGKLKLVLFSLVVALLIGGHLFLKHKAVSEAITNTERKYIEIMAKEVEEAQKASIGLLENAVKDIEKKNAEIKNLSGRVDKLSNSLQQRTSRKDINTGSSGTACTGAELLREDGDFLVREASRADRVTIERDYYYEQYNRAREALSSLKESNERLWR